MHSLGTEVAGTRSSVAVVKTVQEAPAILATIAITTT